MVPILAATLAFVLHAAGPRQLARPPGAIVAGSARRSALLREARIRLAGDSGPGKDGPSTEYNSPILEVVGRFLPARESSSGSGNDADLESVAWDKAKAPEGDMERVRARLEQFIGASEYFVTGLVQPELFSSNFVFKDPDVTIQGLKDYARGVRKLFDQDTSRAELVNCTVTSEDTVTAVWRLSGCVRIGPLRVELKPYLVITELKVDTQGLIVYQEDTFAIPSWDILLSALLPLLRPLLAPPAPSVEVLRARNLPMG